VVMHSTDFGDFSKPALPHNIEAERALLGAILVNNECFHRVSDFLKPEHFLDNIHPHIFKLAGELIRAGKIATPVTIKDFLPSNLDVAGLTVVQYLARLCAEAASIINSEDYGRTIYDLALRRQAIQIYQDAINGAKCAPVDNDPLQQLSDVADKLRRLTHDIHPSNRRRLNLIDMSNWDNEPVPERKWAIRDCVPLHQAGLLSGEGGTGKSILELTKNVAHVTGKDWLGLLPEPGPTIYVGAEDSKDEIHIRLAAIAKHYGVTFKELVDGGLHILCLLGEDATLVAVNGKGGTVETTNLYRQLYEAAGDIKPKNISIDTLSRAFAGDEINRVQVYAFASYMQKIAKVADGSVTVLSHPSLAGMASGSGLSGSTAWHGAFRFRQYFTGVKAETGEQPDSDLRQLEFKKNQYGPLGKTIVVRYQNGLFLPERGMSNLDKAAREAEADRTFIDLLKRFLEAGRNVSDKSSSPNYAPRAFAKEAEAKKTDLRSAELEEAMRRLFANSKIVVEPYGKESNRHERIGVKNA
jgi:RecA-family ATPase